MNINLMSKILKGTGHKCMKFVKKKYGRKSK